MKRTASIVTALLLVSFAVPALAGDYGKCEKSAEACLHEYSAKLKNKGWVGIEMEKTEDHAMQVVRVVPDSPAEKAGFQGGDVLAGFNGIAYSKENKAALKKASAKMQPGKTVTYTVHRGDEKVDLQVELATIPETVMAQWIGQHMLTAHLDQSDEEAKGGP